MSDWPKLDLDNTQQLLATDSQEMLRLTCDYPAQFRLGLQLVRACRLPAGFPAGGALQRVIVLGTGGGSAAAVQLVRAWLRADLACPVELVQGYDLPGYADEETLCIAISHSGNTEEILTTFAAAGERGCPRLAVTAGGKLAALATAAGVPVLTIPGGMMPRIAIGLLVPALVRLLGLTGVAPDVISDAGLWDEVGRMLACVSADCAPDVPVSDNPAKQLTLAIGQRIPVVYGALDLTWAAALRWKNQFGENSKRLAFWNAVPQLHHDEAVGWEMAPELMSQLAVVALRDAGDSAKIRQRWDATIELLRPRAGAVLEPKLAGVAGEARLTRLLRQVAVGDFVTIYTALADGVDPTPVRIIDLFKRRLSEAEQS
ncbi:MAG: bifunctional phosphoglucose/phosphomannose isomerase [Chloroflexota bacterium]